VCRRSRTATVDVFCAGLCTTIKITIATQCDLRRFAERLPRMADVWAGPMVIAVLVKSMEDSVPVKAILDAPGSETLSWCVAPRPNLSPAVVPHSS